MIWILACGSGIVTLINPMNVSRMPHIYSLIIALPLLMVIGAVFGIVNLYLISGLSTLTGKWLKGSGQFKQVRCACAWASVPVIWSILFILVEIWLIGPQIYVHGQQLLPYLHPHTLLFFHILGFVQIAYGIWSYIIFINCISAAHQFSNWRAFASNIIAILLLIVACLLVLLLVVISHNLMQLIF